jgi:hypothetical protein
MDQTDQLIVCVTAQKQPLLTIETNYGNKYVTDLSGFKTVYCFPKSQKEWENVSISTGGFAITWGCRFEMHIDQVVAEATHIESLQSKAMGV